MALKIKIKILINFVNKITITLKYLNYADIFSFKFRVKFPKYNNNNHIIKLKKDK